ncbi:hypothetical protein GCM10007084_13390 [Parabacteroides faecis]|nr:hypothetical protein GCM10007084_13390 [Parabacteroides faecis]
MSFLSPILYRLSYSTDKKGDAYVKKSMKIIADKKLLFTFAEVFDDRMKRPIE